MKNMELDNLIHAYLDGELTDHETQRIEKILTDDPEARQTFRELKKLQSCIRKLPAQRLGTDLTDRVLSRAEQQILTGGPAPESQPMPSSTLDNARQADRSGSGSVNDTTTPHWKRLLTPRTLGFPAAAVAIALIIALFGPTGQQTPDNGLAINQPHTNQHPDGITTPVLDPANNGSDTLPDGVSLDSAAGQRISKNPGNGVPGTTNMPLCKMTCKITQDSLRRNVIAELLKENDLDFDKQSVPGKNQTIYQFTIAAIRLPELMEKLQDPTTGITELLTLPKPSATATANLDSTSQSASMARIQLTVTILE